MIEKLEQIDRSLFLWLNGKHAPALDVCMYYVSAIFIFTPLFIWWFYEAYKLMNARKLFVMIVMMGLVIVLADQSSNRVKHAVQRYRPTHNIEIGPQVHIVNGYKGGQYGFFSGHAANTFGIAMFVYLMFKGKKRIFRMIPFIWAILTSYSRIYLGVHYPSDIFVGMCTGLLWGFLMYRLADWLTVKYVGNDESAN
ncbi:MAG: phosphatase PAP2 family protein [Bacteroidetes bacterium]|nr:phosphatase PAP2 family protein [Bacteroidota bacterium]